MRFKENPKDFVLGKKERAEAMTTLLEAEKSGAGASKQVDIAAAAGGPAPREEERASASGYSNSAKISVARLDVNLVFLMR